MNLSRLYKYTTQQYYDEKINLSKLKQDDTVWARHDKNDIWYKAIVSYIYNII